MTTLYEIMELPNGEIVLKRADEEGEPLVSIKFSEESAYFLKDIKVEVAKAMIEAGLDAVSENGFEPDDSDFDDEEPIVLH